MEFGKVTDPNQIDFSLPKDHPDTEKLLKLYSCSKSDFKILLGGATWGRNDWMGKLYPKGTKQSDCLRLYSNYFNTIELNATFYGIQNEKTIQTWYKESQRDFIFCPKIFKGISHTYPLGKDRHAFNAYLDSIKQFKEKLGMIFLQLSEYVAPNRINEIERFIKTFPKLPLGIEIRHPMWFQSTEIVDYYYKLLRSYRITSIITDTSGRRDALHMRLSTPVAFIRFVGNNLHSTDYKRIDEWALRLLKWKQLGLKKVYFFIHQHNELYAPELASYTVKCFNTVLKSKLRSIPLMVAN